jgi:hypothetical protein
MIVINNSAFIILGDDSATPKRVKECVVKYSTPNKGKLNAWLTLNDVDGNEVCNGLITEYEQSYFVGGKIDILATLHNEFKSTLETLNQSLTFTIE